MQTIKFYLTVTILFSDSVMEFKTLLLTITFEVANVIPQLSLELYSSIPEQSLVRMILESCQQQGWASGHRTKAGMGSPGGHRDAVMAPPSVGPGQAWGQAAAGWGLHSPLCPGGFLLGFFVREYVERGVNADPVCITEESRGKL